MDEQKQAKMEEIEAKIIALEDAGFDAGEWSGPAHDQCSLEAEVNKILEKHGVSREEYEIWAWGDAPEHKETDHGYQNDQG